MYYYSVTQLPSYLALLRMTGPNKKAVLQNGEMVLRDNISIRFNSWAFIGCSNLKEVPKHMRIRIHLCTDNLGPGGHKNNTQTSIGTKIIDKLERIEDSPKVWW